MTGLFAVIEEFQTEEQATLTIHLVPTILCIVFYATYINTSDYMSSH